MSNMHADMFMGTMSVTPLFDCTVECCCEPLAVPTLESHLKMIR
jgi:hypothetical protein